MIEYYLLDKVKICKNNIIPVNEPINAPKKAKLAAFGEKSRIAK